MQPAGALRRHGWRDFMVSGRRCGHGGDGRLVLAAPYLAWAIRSRSVARSASSSASTLTAPYSRSPRSSTNQMYRVYEVNIGHIPLTPHIPITYFSVISRWFLSGHHNSISPTLPRWSRGDKHYWEWGPRFRFEVDWVFPLGISQWQPGVWTPCLGKHIKPLVLRLISSQLSDYRPIGLWELGKRECTCVCAHTFISCVLD